MERFNKLKDIEAIVLWDELRWEKRNGTLGALFWDRLKTKPCSRADLLKLLYKKF